MRFTKMQGLGNDFVVIDGIRQSLRLEPDQVRRLADRRLGIGCDQLLVAEPPDAPGMDVRYRIYNADGSEVEHCGNGVRCLAVFLRDQGLLHKRELRVQTATGAATVLLRDDDQVTVDMGPPRLEPADIPFDAPRRAREYDLDVAGVSMPICAISMGNPHAVLRVDDVASAPVARIGPLIETHVRFPNRVNAGFMEIVDAAHIRLRVHERGTGETPACGTGACAAVVAGRLLGLLGPDVRVDLPGGTLRIHWEGEGQPVWMTGPAVSVFQGEWPND